MKALEFARRHVVLVGFFVVVFVLVVMFAVSYDRYGQGREVPGDRDDVFQTP